ncbi:hypothetical protein DACRYDRAFT_24613 [Dacryopinax primogenitus]|uniref:FHA domain-containing protein n=1 Tax=Dacryopinax primogenitus (strain DJM 731) TaxID=1858805 RepID=M5FNY9_DACPD|nr:uncharacterized protein DACRYDRAFT_24613 [Dacryopinax primogenitus]EJT98075.1 hypothetical protein DACRYDRAFT_24613 [Dacryopinax primogenitus]
MAFHHARSHPPFPQPPAAAPSPVTPAYWADRIRSTMRSTIGLATPPEPRSRNAWSFPSPDSFGSRRYDWEQPFNPSESQALDRPGIAEVSNPPFHPGIRLHTLPPYPPQSVFELVPTHGKTVFILGRNPSERDAERSRSNGGSDNSDGDAEIVTMHSRVVSKKHARIEFTEDEVYITDLESTHGTWVLRDGSTDHFLGNDVPFALKDRDEIRIGRRVHGYPAVHLVVEMLGNHPRIASIASGRLSKPLTPNNGTPLTPPATRRRSTNSFRAPDFSDMDLSSRSTSPSPASTPVPSFAPGLRSPIILDHALPPLANETHSSIQNAPSLMAFADTVRDELQGSLLPSNEALREPINGPLDEDEVPAIPHRDPRPYEYVMNSSVLNRLAVDETQLPSPPIAIGAQPAVASVEELSAEVLPLINELESMLPSEPGPTVPSCQSMSTPHSPAPDASHVHSPTILVPETAIELRTLSQFEEHSGHDQFLDNVEITTESIRAPLASEIPPTVLEPINSASASNKSFTRLLTDNASQSVATNSVEVLDDPLTMSSDAYVRRQLVSGTEHHGNREGTRDRDMDGRVRELSTLLNELREQTAQNIETKDKWKKVDGIMRELRHVGISDGTFDKSRKRKRLDENNLADNQDENDRQGIEPEARSSQGMVTNTKAAKDAVGDTRPAKRRRSFAPSSTALAFVAGGAAVWIALGVDYGI